MKGGIGFGLLLIAGIVWLLMNMESSPGGICFARVLWPLIIIAVGINMMFRNRTVALTWFSQRLSLSDTDIFTRSRMAARNRNG